MRIIAGELGGRQFASPRSAGTHPMSDRVRGALFNTLGDINGLSLLDAFAGSGAIGFEAISRGASRVLALENDRAAQRTITANSRELQLPPRRYKLVAASCSAWHETNRQQLFDIVCADPPFHDLQAAVLVKMIGHVSSGGLFVLNWPGKQDLPDLSATIQLVAHKVYGDTQLAFYRG